jgi:regulator of protease activity HflC (stomatin/prohibitin superfamily)
LYHIQKENVPNLISTVGLQYENIIRSVFRSASADVCSKYYAKDMHSGKRGEIEENIQLKMIENLAEKGIIIEAVLMKTIKLPDGLYSSIENRMEAEQDAMRMQFILEQEKLEAQRKIIEAEGIRDAQIILSEGLTEEILQLKSIEAFLKLSESSGAKVIITGNGQVPYLINE